MFPALRAVSVIVFASSLFGQTKPELAIENEPYGDGSKIVQTIPSELPKVLDTVAEGPVKTTLCEMAKDPERFDGKMVQFRASISGYREITLEDFTVPRGCSAYMRVVLEFPANVKPIPNFALERDSSFRQYEAALREPVVIQATMTGRFDGAFVWANQKRRKVGDGKGFGGKHDADGRLVLLKLSDVEIHYVPNR